MVELILAVLILIAAIYVIYRLATDPASDLYLDSRPPAVNTQSGQGVEGPATEVEASAKQDGSLASVGVAPPD